MRPEAAPGSQDLGPKIWTLRARRKKIAATCLFLMITTVILGVRLAIPFHPLLLALLILLAALFSRHCFRTLTPYGWV